MFVPLSPNHSPVTPGERSEKLPHTYRSLVWIQYTAYGTIADISVNSVTCFVICNIDVKSLTIHSVFPCKQDCDELSVLASPDSPYYPRNLNNLLQVVHDEYHTSSHVSFNSVHYVETFVLTGTIKYECLLPLLWLLEQTVKQV